MVIKEARSKWAEYFVPKCYFTSKCTRRANSDGRSCGKTVWCYIFRHSKHTLYY